MFTKRELYIIANTIFEKKNSLKKSEEGKIKMSPEAFDDYLELSALHLKIKGCINER